MRVVLTPFNLVFQQKFAILEGNFSPMLDFSPPTTTAKRFAQLHCLLIAQLATIHAANCCMPRSDVLCTFSSFKIAANCRLRRIFASRLYLSRYCCQIL